MKPKSKYLQHLNSATFTSFIIVSEKVKAKSEKKGNDECIKPWYYYFKSRKILARTTVLNQSKMTNVGRHLYFKDFKIVLSDYTHQFTDDSVLKW